MKYLVLLCLTLIIPKSGSTADSPNILFIMADDLGYGDPSCYGAEDIKTPHIDRLAEEGIKFTSFYANAPTCSPTRAAFLTGRYQQRIGLDNALYYQEMERGLQPGAPNIANDLREKGYVTGLCGKWHLGYDEGRTPTDQGFDHFFGLLGGNHHYFQHMDRIGVPDLWLGKEPVESDDYTTDLITECAKGFIQKNSGKSFFLYLSHAAPHFPFQGPDDRDKTVQPKKKNWQIGDRETYRKMVERMDEGIGEVFTELDRQKLRENTLVIFTSDNGGDVHSRNAPFSGGKSTLAEGGIRVPCIARWPGKLQAGRTISAPTITMDWSATFRRIAGYEADPDREDGIDLMPLLTGSDDSFNDRPLFWRRKSGPGRKVKNPGRAVRRGKWKYVENYSGEREQLLYDLEADPAETANAAGENGELVEELKKELDRWEKVVEVR